MFTQDPQSFNPKQAALLQDANNPQSPTYLRSRFRLGVSLLRGAAIPKVDRTAGLDMLFEVYIAGKELAHQVVPSITEFIETISSSPAIQQELNQYFQQNLKLASETLNPKAQLITGLCYMHGIGTDKNPKQTFEYYKLAAEQKYPPAQNKLGFCFLNEIGTGRDPKQAFEYHKLAAEQKYPPAQNNLAYCFLYGTGTPVSEKDALDWLIETVVKNHHPIPDELRSFANENSQSGQMATRILNTLRERMRQPTPPLAASNPQGIVMTSISSSSNNNTSGTGRTTSGPKRPIPPTNNNNTRNNNNANSNMPSLQVLADPSIRSQPSQVTHHPVDLKPTTQVLTQIRKDITQLEENLQQSASLVQNERNKNEQLRSKLVHALQEKDATTKLVQQQSLRISSLEQEINALKAQLNRVEQSSTGNSQPYLTPQFSISALVNAAQGTGSRSPLSLDMEVDSTDHIQVKTEPTESHTVQTKEGEGERDSKKAKFSSARKGG